MVATCATVALPFMKGENKKQNQVSGLNLNAKKNVMKTWQR